MALGEDEPMRGGGVRRSLVCNSCQQEGHFARECPERQQTRRCRKCDKVGHIARDCQDSVKCHNCKESGHMISECPYPNTSGKPVPVKYVPVEEGDDRLFEGAIAPGVEFDKVIDAKVEVSGDITRQTPRIKSFVDAGFTEQLLENVKRAEYKRPTPIQSCAIPVIQNGQDIMGCAQTGSGKTAAYLLPIINTMLKKNIGVGDGADHLSPVAIILSPARELAIQIQRETKKFAFGTTLKAQTMYGGTDVQHGMNKLREGCGIVVATPGRLLHFIRDGHIGLHRVKWLVLDEADRMLDLGFEPDIRTLVQNNDMPDKTQRQTLMFSATFPESIQKLAKGTNRCV